MSSIVLNFSGTFAEAKLKDFSEVDDDSEFTEDRFYIIRSQKESPCLPRILDPDVMSSHFCSPPTP